MGVHTVLLNGFVVAMAASAWAQDINPVEIKSVGTAYSAVEYDPHAADFAGTVRVNSEGAQNVLGPYTCYGESTFRVVNEPADLSGDVTGACEEAQVFTYAYESRGAECRVTNTGQIFTVDVDRAVACFPSSCFGFNEEAGAYLPKVGCTYTALWTGHLLEKGGILEGTTDIMEKSTYEAVEWDADRGLVVARLNSIQEGTVSVTITVPDDELPVRDALIEIPPADATVSGIGLVSGWSCLGGHVGVEFREADGTLIGTFPVSHGSPRADTEPVCGDTANGFSATINWNLLGAGEKTVSLIQNGEVLASQSFSVVAFDEEFLQDVSISVTVDNFPSVGREVTLEWSTAQQSFVVTEIR